jgi:uncharacterized protein (UPF0303 family)
MPLGIEIFLNGLEVFRFFPDGITRNHELWLKRKRNSVEFQEMSTWRLKMMAEMKNETLESWLVDPAEYVLGGGGYPIKLRGTGMVGSICVSGYPDIHDHEMVTWGLKKLHHLKRQDSGGIVT